MREGLPLGDTAFRNMYAAYAALPAAMQQRLDGLEAVHEFEKIWSIMLGKGSKRPPMTDAQRAQKPPVVHPVVLVHPWTGRKALYVNRGITQTIVGLPRAESFRRNRCRRTPRRVSAALRAGRNARNLYPDSRCGVRRQSRAIRGLRAAARW